MEHIQYGNLAYAGPPAHSSGNYSRNFLLQPVLCLLCVQPPYPVATFSTVSFYFFGELGMYGVSAALNLFTVLALVVLIWWFNRWSKAAEGVTYA